jgi:hypothetical protein
MPRAQTTMDFAVGVSVFLLTVAFAVAFVPGVITPFADVDAGDPVTANRVADDLAGDRLAAPDAPYDLDEDATAAFFDGDAGLTDRLSLRSYTSVNVTLVDAADDPVVVDGVRATAGSPVPVDADTTVAWRVVAVDGDRLELVVRVW